MLPEGLDTRAYFGALIDRAGRFATEHRLFTIPEAPVSFVAIPDGMIHGGAVTNWPAPLLDRSRPGHVALALSSSSHARAFSTGLAVHEATPGHYLQSAIWQSQAAPDREPVRFVAVHDDVAGATSFFGAMPSIEGFAVHAENVMRAAGFYDPDAEVASIGAAIIRDARAVVDLAIHDGRLSFEEAIAEMVRLCGMPASWCETQVVRFLRIPLQATTYFVGERRHARMFAAAREREGASLRVDHFHDALVALGPASLTTLERRVRDRP